MCKKRKFCIKKRVIELEEKQKKKESNMEQLKKAVGIENRRN